MNPTTDLLEKLRQCVCNDVFVTFKKPIGEVRAGQLRIRCDWENYTWFRDFPAAAFDTIPVALDAVITQVRLIEQTRNGAIDGWQRDYTTPNT